MENKTKKLLIPMNYDIKIGKARAKGLVGDHWHLLVLDVGKQHWEHYNSRIRGKLGKQCGIGAGNMADYCMAYINK